MNESTQAILDSIRAILTRPLFSIGATPITLLTVTKLLVFMALVLVVARVINRYMGKVLARTRLSTSVRYAISKVASYVFVSIGAFVAFQMVGIDLSALAVMAGAVGVGIGIGLQNVVNNFVSGLIILAERPIAIGDRVEVAGVAGQVAEINLRSTTVLTNDNIAVIVPNAEFITQSVINWSHGDSKVRMRLPFGVAYGSDLETLRRVASEMAAQHPKVLADPPPTVFFIGFGESSLDFELVVWTEEMTFAPRRFRSDLYFGLENVLRAHRIEIPFPQRDLHIRTGGVTLQRDALGGLPGRHGA